MKESTMKTLTPFESALKDVEKTRSEENGKRAPGGERASTVDPLFQNLKIRIHRKLIDTIDLTKLSTLETEMIKVEIRRILEEMVMTESLPLNRIDRERLVTEVQHEAFGLGPIEFLMKDSTIADILVNTHSQVYVERYGRLEKTDIRFHDDAHLLQIIDRIVSRVGRRVDESSPMVDARLPDGSRVNAIIPPLSLDGPILSIRRFGRERLNAQALVTNASISTQMLELLEGCVRGKLNIMISGGTGAGKTTFLNILSGYIPSTERIVTIEDAAELQLRQDHVVRLETRPPNIEGVGAVKQRHLVINALRMRPDRIVVGEVRGEEAVDMLQAMNTGHDGSLTTIHANTPRDALSRLETMVAMANLNLPDKAIRWQISSAINLVVQINRLPDGTRKVMSVTEVTGRAGPVITIQDLFGFNRQGIDANGKVKGRFRPSGIRPKVSEKLVAAGISFNIDTFFSET